MTNWGAIRFNSQSVISDGSNFRPFLTENCMTLALRPHHALTSFSQTFSRKLTKNLKTCQIDVESGTEVWCCCLEPFLTRAGPGGGYTPPPSGFSQIAGKRRRAAPQNFAYLFSHLFRILRQKISTMWPKVRSPGHFEWPNLTKSLNLHQSYNCWVIDTKVSGVDEGHSIYKMYISDFWYLWPEVRSISRPPHYKSMGEISTSSECYPIHSIWSG